ncbi:hypothetical protein PSCFBP3800_01439 [Pseudomonas syringae group genomosp. 3]|uniref:Uncharacterized protein n=1 Tax=Pseudomonas syringae group genomosp. 3 TaxID=251701 RepID=A0A2K4W9E3_9PSED|nr:hypothetical protein CFBP6411_01143 [Pseudomonas syringae group genomosp. 3]SPF11484.1 hypothetical protein PSCFBP3800_01439 [Pseudomonas syringae group genomosp. 3]
MCTDRATLRLSANCREPAAKPADSVHQIQPRWPVLGRFAAHREQVRSHALRAETLCVRTGRRFACGSGLVRELPGTGSKTSRLRCTRYNQGGRLGALRSPSRTSSLHALRAETRYVYGPGDASLVRTCPRTAGNRQQNQPPRCTRYNQGGRFWAASQPIANKFAPTPSGQKRAMCTDWAMLRLCGSGPGDASLVRELPGTGSETSRLGAPDTTKVAGFGPLRSPSRTSEASPGCSYTLRAEALIASTFKPCA